MPPDMGGRTVVCSREVVDQEPTTGVLGPLIMAMGTSIAMVFTLKPEIALGQHGYDAHIARKVS